MFILAVCGRRLFPEPKIVGGDRSSFGKWPWQVSIETIILRLSINLKDLGLEELNQKYNETMPIQYLSDQID
jgi:hypothetical protein